MHIASSFRRRNQALIFLRLQVTISFSFQPHWLLEEFPLGPLAFDAVLAKPSPIDSCSIRRLHSHSDSRNEGGWSVLHHDPFFSPKCNAINSFYFDPRAPVDSGTFCVCAFMAVPPTGKSQDYPWTNSMAMKPVNGTPHLLDEPPPSRPQFANASAWPPRVLDLAPPTSQKQIAPIQLGSRRGFPLHSTISRHWSLVKQHIRRKLLELSATSMEPNNPIQVEAGRTPSRSMAYDGPTSAEDVEAGVHPIVDAEEIDEVVVDRPWSGEQVELLNPDDHCNRHTSSQPPSLTGSAAAIHNDCNSTGALTGTHSQHQSPGIWACYRVLMILRLKLWPYVMRFFSSKFEDEGTERSYQQEMWCQSKKMCLWSSTFFIFNWVVEVVFLQRPLVLADKIFYYAVTPALTIPLVLLCALDFPSSHNTFYQIYLCLSTWVWPFYQILFIALCGYYDHDGSLLTCGNKDLLSTFYYTSALQAIALFGAHLQRFPALFGAVTFVVASNCLITPFPVSWPLNITNFITYQGVLLYIHYEREFSARKLYALRLQLDSQVQQTQQAKLNEREAADSKRRLTSYVRVPLNTALLAVQNIDASGRIGKEQELEFSALEGSLSMMSKVLNDILDFNRMESGRFESLSKPYAFHQVMQSMFLPLRLATDARNLELVIDLDMNIDDIARRAVYQASGQSNESITRRLEERPSGENHWGTVLGDEMRLRQIVTNLASNACKFTPSGGKLTVTTRLVAPPLATRFREPNYGSKRQARSSPNRSPSLASLQFNPEMPEQIIVRIEVSDTGSGIHPNEMAQSNLFSAFNQTEKGRQQGGKGTGLGLALVRHIVQLSGGRLGLRSKVGVGSTFWVELPLGIGSRVLDSSNSGISRTPTPVSASRPDNSILPSRHITPRISDANVDLPSKMTSPVPCPRSSSALHGLMDQGGSVELILPRYNSYSKIPTRTLGDASTGTDYPCPGTEHDYYPPRRYVDSLVPRSIHSAVIPLPDSLADCADHQITFGLSNLRIDQPPTPLAVEGPSVKGAVLVVDDDHLTRALMSRLLKRMGYSVITAENGRVALDILLGSDIPTKSGANNHEIGQKFLAVFMDNQMPVMSGHEAVTTLRSQGRKDFVVGVTGNALLSDQKEYLAAGADYVLTKPVFERSLQAMLNFANERRESHHSA